jgi:hypothetical protein
MSRAHDELSLDGIGYHQLPELSGDREKGMFEGRIWTSSCGSYYKVYKGAARTGDGVHIQNRRPRRLAKTSAARQSSSTSAKRTELVIISDSEPESEHHDDN